MRWGAEDLRRVRLPSRPRRAAGCAALLVLLASCGGEAPPPELAPRPGAPWVEVVGPGDRVTRLGLEAAGELATHLEGRTPGRVWTTDPRLASIAFPPLPGATIRGSDGEVLGAVDHVLPLATRGLLVFELPRAELERRMAFLRRLAGEKDAPPDREPVPAAPHLGRNVFAVRSRGLATNGLPAGVAHVDGSFALLLVGEGPQDGVRKLEAGLCAVPLLAATPAWSSWALAGSVPRAGQVAMATVAVEPVGEVVYASPLGWLARFGPARMRTGLRVVRGAKWDEGTYEAQMAWRWPAHRRLGAERQLGNDVANLLREALAPATAARDGALSIRFVVEATPAAGTGDAPPAVLARGEAVVPLDQPWILQQALGGWARLAAPSLVADTWDDAYERVDVVFHVE